MKQWNQVFFVCACTFLGVNTSYSAPITFSFSGVVDSVYFNNGTPTEFSVGDTLSGTYTFDSLANDSHTDPTRGYYLSSLISADILLGSFSASGSTTGNILVINSTSDIYQAEQISPSGNSILGLQFQDFTLNMTDASGTAIAGEALPLSPPDLGDFGIRSLELQFADHINGNFGNVTASLHSLTTNSLNSKPQISVEGGFIKLDITNGNIPSSGDCSSNEHYGRQIYDEINGTLYLCSQSGWLEH